MCDEEFTELDNAIMKIGITCAFAKRYDMSIPDVTMLFEDNGIYDFLDTGEDMFITKRYGYMANFIAKRLGIPVSEKACGA